MTRLKLSFRAIQDAVTICSNQLRAENGDFFAKALAGIAFRNAFVTLQGDTIEVRPHDPAHRARHALPFDYDPEAPCPLWDKFLREVFTPVAIETNGDRGEPEPIDDGAQRAALLHEFAGVCLFGIATRFGRLLILLGDGDNGKSVILKVLATLFPKEGVVSIAPHRWSKSCYLADLAGKVLNLVAEMPAQDVAESDIFKAVITGDGVTADRKYERPFRFYPRAGHLIACNKLPATRDHTRGFWKRPIVLVFNRIFLEHEQDEQLADKLIASELPGIAARLIEHARLLLARHQYTIPASSDRMKQRWRSDADQVAEFFAECIEPTKPEDRTPKTANGLPKLAVPARALYDLYNQWAIHSGHRPLHISSFGERIKVFIEKDRSDSVRYYWCTFKTDARQFCTVHDEHYLRRELPEEEPKRLINI